jgi:hypothetical protein
LKEGIESLVLVLNFGLCEDCHSKFFETIQDIENGKTTDLFHFDFENFGCRGFEIPSILG